VDLRQRLADGAEHNGAWKAELLDAVQAAWRVMWINRFRTALTLLGIIGVASVVVMLAVGEGSKRQVMAQMGVRLQHPVPERLIAQPAHAAGHRHPR
jgi:macrolide transport system ATP-binding/permease protein